MKAHELRDMSREELQQTLGELYQEQFNLRFQMSARQLNDVTRVKQVRRDIARVKTVMRERELAEVE